MTAPDGSGLQPCVQLHVNPRRPTLDEVGPGKDGWRSVVSVKCSPEGITVSANARRRALRTGGSRIEIFWQMCRLDVRQSRADGWNRVMRVSPAPKRPEWQQAWRDRAAKGKLRCHAGSPAATAGRSGIQRISVRKCLYRATRLRNHEGRPKGLYFEINEDFNLNLKIDDLHSDKQQRIWERLGCIEWKRLNSKGQPRGYRQAVLVLYEIDFGFLKNLSNMPQVVKKLGETVETVVEALP